MPKADGSIIIDTRIRDEGLIDEFQKLTKEFSSLGKNLKELAGEIRAFVAVMSAANPEAEDFAKAVEDTAQSAEALSESAEEGAENAEAFTREIEEAGQEAEEAARDIDKLGDETEKLGEESEKAKNGLGELFGQMLSASAIADLAVDALRQTAAAIKDFVVDSIEAAAEVSASNAQFEQTFKELEDTAEKSLQNISKQTKISVTRMKNSYSSVYAFTKSVGADSATAMDIANRAMVAAADSAAYYDRSIEDATETLQSFLKGNYENDAALGIAATETTRNAKANELYAKSFDKLSEAQKVDVLLAMVEAGNKASGALGQAAREAKSWANVTGEASEAVRQLMAELGKPVLEAVIPRIQKITKAINDLLEKSASQQLRENMQEIADSWKAAEEQFRMTSDEINSTAIKADFYINRLEALEAAGLKTAESQKQYSHIVRLLNELYPELNLQVDENTGLLKENTDQIRLTVDAMKKKALAAAYERRYADALNAQADAAAAVTEATYELTRVSEDRKQIADQLTESTGKSIEELKQLYISQKQANAAMYDSPAAAAGATLGMLIMNGTTQALTQSEMDMVEQLMLLEGEQEKLTGMINEGNQTVSEYDAQLEVLVEQLGFATEATGENAAGQEEANPVVQSATQNILNLAKAHEEARLAARESIDTQIGLFDELNVKSEKTTSEIIKNWEKQQKAFEEYSLNLEKAINMGLDEDLVQQLSDGSVESMAILDEFVNGTSANMDQINEAFGKLKQAKDVAAESMANVQTNVQEKLKGIVADAGEAGVDTVAALAKNIANNSGQLSNAMKKLAYEALAAYNSVMKIPLPKQSGSGSSGTASALPDPAAIEPAAYSIPYLASGAVIPPNAPFMAVLGDQRNGTNIEAPLSTIQEAVALVMEGQMSAMMAGFEALLEENRLLRNVVEGIEVGDTTIGQAADRYNRKMSVVRGAY